jgi:hypothetical protein
MCTTNSAAPRKLLYDRDNQLTKITGDKVVDLQWLPDMDSNHGSETKRARETRAQRTLEEAKAAVTVSRRGGTQDMIVWVPEWFRVRYGASVPTWTLEAYDSEGKVVGSAGEERGLPPKPQRFSIEGYGIVRVRLSTDNRFGSGTGATWNSLPVAEFETGR